MPSIKYTNSPTSDEISILTDGLREYNKEHGMDSQKTSMFYIEHDGKIVAGCLMKKAHNNLHIDHLWVDKCFRKCGYGTELMMLAETYAKEQGCTLITVFTMSWHAPEFYKKLGYRVEFERSGYPKDTSLYMMRKDIDGTCEQA